MSAFPYSEVDIHFRQKVSPVIQGRTFEIPPPTLCPECRHWRRATHCNDFMYYRRACDRCHKSIVSVHHSSQPYPVYCTTCWWEGSWRADLPQAKVSFSESFFTQFYALRRRTPHLAMINDNGTQSENCEYCQNFAYGKNCYLVTGSWNDEDCLYSNMSGYCKEVVDCEFVNIECELVYESLCCTKLYHCRYLVASSGCNYCTFGYDLIGCSHCFACSGLRHQSYCIENKQVTREEYENFMLTTGYLGSYTQQQYWQNRFTALLQKTLLRASMQIGCESCEGDALFRCHDSLGVRMFDAERCRYYYNGDAPKNSQDIEISGKTEWCLEGNSPDESYQALFTDTCWRTRDVLYSESCFGGHDLFGCCGLERGEYRILNTPYSRDEYEALVPRLIEMMIRDKEWGEFFPATQSLFAYNESRAYEILPLSEEETSAHGYRWRTPEPHSYDAKEVLNIDDIQSAPQFLCNSLWQCSGCAKAYRIIPQEFAFLKKMALPLPRYCPSCRRRARIAQRGMKMVERDCVVCNERIQSPYSHEQLPLIACDTCISSS